MKTCDDNDHGEICFEGNRWTPCPACARIDALAKDLQASNQKVAALMQDLDELALELEAQKEPVIQAIKAVHERQ